MVHLAPEQHVRAILLALLDDPSVKARALNHYRRLKAADNPVTGLKRKAMNDLFVCVQCDQAFTHQDNTETSCRYHPGGRKGCTKGKHQADPAKSRRGGNVPSGGDLRKNNGSHYPVSDEDTEEEEEGDEEY
ncbi:uncharacterized protein FTJAE_1580 [Fusarium tjaetaba]|uniref:C2H2-type domain-containing protein n=1 Tax=Fusarium tjaetaba TaxID=1567544 RepID=A0A8H5W775_9HYPO|nr:uncharacterized protein FTJAE_1580 [Fusarium tjaetaba]KAF5647524.1 hypothetical protein FTJAE_1580 [Fusarium tjaetaba]